MPKISNFLYRKNKRLVWFCSILLIWGLGLTYFHNAQTGGHNGFESNDIIHAKELKDIIDSDENVTIINVLSKEAYDDCHIPGSIHIALDELESAIKEFNHDTNIIVYCASRDCTAGSNAYQTLKELGFTHVRTYQGGMREWKNIGYQTMGVCSLDYLKSRQKNRNNPKIEDHQ